MRLLVISHVFPPSRFANAKRPYYLVKGFLDAGWTVDLFCLRSGMEAGAPETVSHPRLRIFRSEDFGVRSLEKLKKHPRLFRAASLLWNGIMWPDELALWSSRTLRACQRAGPYDRVLTFVIPASLLLSGRMAGFVGPHWTFDYQESVTPQQRRLPRRSPLQRFMLPRLTKLESHTLHTAGRVVFTADTNRRVYIKEGLVDEARTAHVPYFYDAEVFRDAGKNMAPDFEVRYFGTFDWRGARNPETFLRSLARFLAKRPEARPRTRFVFYGDWLFEHHRFIEELKLKDVVSIHPAVKYEQYLEKLKESPVLLLVVAAAHNLFMPSKIVDYFGARRPILAFVPRESEMRQVLEQAGMSAFACDEFDVESGAAALERLWELYQAGQLNCDSEKTGFWSSEVQIPKYVDLVRGLGQLELASGV